MKKIIPFAIVIFFLSISYGAIDDPLDLPNETCNFTCDDCNLTIINQTIITTNLFDVETINLTSTLISNRCPFFGYIDVKAELNEPRIFYVDFDYNASKLHIEWNDEVKIHGDTKIPVKIQCVDTGSYTFDFDLIDSLGKINKSSTGTLLIDDDISPTIAFIDYPKIVDIGTNYTITVYGTDNFFLEGAFLNHIDDDYRFAEQNYFKPELDDISTEVYFSKYTFIFNKKLKGDSTDKIYLVDKQGNKESYSIVIKALPKEYVSFDDVIIPKLRTGKKITTTIMNSVEEVFLTIKLNYSFDNFQNNTGEPLFFLYADGNVYGVELDKEINLTAKKLELSLYSDYFGYLNGTISYKTNNQYVLLNDKTNFEVEFGNVTVLPERNFVVSGREVTCQLEEGNQTEDDVYRCFSEFPIGTELNDVGLIITKYDLDLLKQMWENKLQYQEWKTIAAENHIGLLNSILFIFIFSLVIYVIYTKYVPTHLKWK